MVTVATVVFVVVGIVVVGTVVVVVVDVVVARVLLVVVVGPVVPVVVCTGPAPVDVVVDSAAAVVFGTVVAVVGGGGTVGPRLCGLEAGVVTVKVISVVAVVVGWEARVAVVGTLGRVVGTGAVLVVVGATVVEVVGCTGRVVDVATGRVVEVATGRVVVVAGPLAGRAVVGVIGPESGALVDEAPPPGAIMVVLGEGSVGARDWPDGLASAEVVVTAAFGLERAGFGLRLALAVRGPTGAVTATADVRVVPVLTAGALDRSAWWCAVSRTEGRVVATGVVGAGRTGGETD